ncbi:MAG: 50S ribosomal protein L30 [Alphaproteobacteria bacterium GM202ARS2]|nr:50S ribosomal protein L30 [Alphaproteobacteria bacterium GM202ARS2]
MAKTDKIKVTRVRSAIRRPKDQQATLIGLGLTRIGKSRIHEDNPAIRGMINKVRHLVRIDPA